MEQFGNKRSKEDEFKLAKEKELQKVQVKKEDIELIVSTTIWLKSSLCSLKQGSTNPFDLEPAPLHNIC